MYHFTVQNLGPIREGAIECAPLTVICGGNNTGKSYLMTAIHGYFDHLHQHPYGEQARSVTGRIGPREVEELYAKGKVAIPMSAEGLADEVEQNMKARTLVYHSRLGQVFAAKDGTFAKARFDASLVRVQIVAMLKDRLEALSSLYDISMAFKHDCLVLEIPATDRNPRLEQGEAQEVLSSFLTHRLLAPPTIQTFYLTSVRGGSALFHEGLDLKQVMQVEKLKHMDDEALRGTGHDLEPRLAKRFPLPVRDELDFLRDLGNTTRLDHGLSPMTAMAPHELIESMMQARYDVDEAGIKLISLDTEEGQFSIPLDLGSSSSKVLAGLYFHLKHLARQGSMIFFDEPENQLSTLNQIRMAQLISVLVNNDVKVVLSTHSEVLLKELNNLIMFCDVGGEKKLVRERFSEYRDLEGIARLDVRCHHCADGKVKQCEVNAWGMMVPSLDENLALVNDHSAFIGSILYEKFH